jgi:hypothetical protein
MFALIACADWFRADVVSAKLAGAAENLLSRLQF